MMKKTVQGFIVLAALLWSTGGAQARDLLKDLQIDVYGLGGGSTIVDAQNFTSAGRLFHTRMEPGYKFSFGVSIPYNKYLSIESGYTYGPNNLVLSNLDVFPHVGTVYASHTYIGNLSAVVHAPVVFHHFRPYGEVGVEYDRFSPTKQAIDYAYYNGWAAAATANMNHNDKFGFSLGAGLDRKLTRRLSLRIDLRDHVTGAPAFGIPYAPNTNSIASYPIKARADDIVYEAGFVYHLGKL
jgi:opacity protein-like surface antigen